MESSVEIKRNSQKKDKKQDDCKGTAVLVKARDVTDLDGLGADDLVG